MAVMGADPGTACHKNGDSWAWTHSKPCKNSVTWRYGVVALWDPGSVTIGIRSIEMNLKVPVFHTKLSKNLLRWIQIESVHFQVEGVVPRIAASNVEVKSALSS